MLKNRTGIIRLDVFLENFVRNPVPELPYDSLNCLHPAFPYGTGILGAVRTVAAHPSCDTGADRAMLFGQDTVSPVSGMTAGTGDLFCGDSDINIHLQDVMHLLLVLPGGDVVRICQGLAATEPAR